MLEPAGWGCAARGLKAGYEFMLEAAGARRFSHRYAAQVPMVADEYMLEHAGAGCVAQDLKADNEFMFGAVGASSFSPRYAAQDLKADDEYMLELAGARRVAQKIARRASLVLFSSFWSCPWQLNGGVIASFTHTGCQKCKLNSRL